MGMDKCKACGRDFASTDPTAEICYPCKQALKRLNGYAVPVVRCKDCKHYSNQAGVCRWYRRTKFDEGFCDRGERRTENADD